MDAKRSIRIRRRTSSKQSPHRSFLAVAKTIARSLAFPLPKKSGGLSGVPESRKTLRGKGATERTGRVCEEQTALSDCCDAREVRTGRSKKRISISRKTPFGVFPPVFLQETTAFFIFSLLILFLRSAPFLHPLLGIGKIVQNCQTEPEAVRWHRER